MESSDHMKTGRDLKSQKSKDQYSSLSFMRKNALAVAALLLTATLLHAQSNVQVKTVDLNANGKTKSSRLVTSDFNAATGESRLTFVKTVCDGDETRGYNSKSFTARDIIYNFEHLHFDRDFSFKKLDTEQINGLQNAIMKYPVNGKDFILNSYYGYVPGANAKGGWLGQFEYAVKMYATSRDGFFYCDQVIEAQKTGLEIPYPAESAVFNHTTMDGVFVLTQNSQTETTVNIRYYDHSGNSKAQTSMKFDYAIALKGTVLKNEKGGEDIIVIAQPTGKYNKYGIKVEKVKADPLEFEYIRIDGTTAQVKERFTFKAVSTQWYPEEAMEHNGAVYLFGPAAAKVKLSEYHFGGIMTTEGGSFQNWLRIDELENYQFIKVKGGKTEYVKSLTPDQMAAVSTVVPGAKGSNSPSGFFRLQEMKFVDDALFITGQNLTMGKEGDNRKQEFIMMINGSGDLTNLYYVPKSNYANSDLFVAPDKKSMYWAIYDYSEHEVHAYRKIPVQIITGFVKGGDDHAMVGKRKIDDGPMLQLVRFDLTNRTAGPLETFGKDEYTLFDESPVLYANDKEVVFLGLAGKVKERVTKVITLKF
jgi:hypothetical protein